MTWTHLSVKQNKSTASSACSFYYLFLASRRVYKTAPYCISWSYPLPPFISVWRLSFRRHDAAPLFAKPRQSPVLNMQWPQRCSLPPSPSLYHCLSLARSHSLVSPHLSFPIVFSLKAQEQPVLSEEIQALPKNSLNLLYNWSLGGKLGLRVGWGRWRVGGLEVWKGQEDREGGLMWRAGNCIRGVWLKITRQSLNWNGSCSNLLPPYLSPNAVKWAKWETATIETAPFLFIYFIADQKWNLPNWKDNPEMNQQMVDDTPDRPAVLVRSCKTIGFAWKLQVQSS